MKITSVGNDASRQIIDITMTLRVEITKGKHVLNGMCLVVTSHGGNKPTNGAEGHWSPLSDKSTANK